MTNFIPIPGDPDRVASGAREMQEAARIMSKAAAELRQIADSASYRSQAIDEFRGHAGELATTLTKASMRYSKSGDALAEYAPKLRAGQEDARDAIRTACSVDVGGAAQRVEHYREEAQQSRSLQDHEEVQRNLTQLSIAQDDLRDQQATLKAAAAQYAAAVRAVQDAAANAADRIKDAEEVSQLNDNLMDDLEGLKERYIDPLAATVKEFLVEVLKPILREIDAKLDEVLGWVSLIASVLTVAGALVFIIGAVSANPFLLALGGGMLMVGRGFAALALVGSFVSISIKLLRTMLGNMSFQQLAVNAIGLGLSLLMRGPAKKIVLGRVQPVVDSSPRGLSSIASRFLFERGARSQIAYGGGQSVSELGGLVLDISEGSAESLFSASGTSSLSVVQLWDGVDAQIDAGIDSGFGGLSEGTHVDVGAISADFSEVNLDQIVAEAFASETVENRGMTCTAGTSHAGGGW